MKHFNGDRREGGYKGSTGGGKPGFQKKPWENRDDRGTDRPQAMFKATCSDCSRPCDVPFRPVNGKPVYCTDCFNKKRDPNDTRGARPAFTPKRDFNDRFAPRTDVQPRGDGKLLSEISMKLDRLITAMERMQATKADAPTPVPATAVAKETAASKKVAVKKVAPKKKAAAKKKK